MDLYPSREKPSPEEGGEKPEAQEEGLLPVSMFPSDVKPGYKCSIEVVGVNGDEVRVVKTGDDKEEDEDEGNEGDEEGQMKDPFSEENLQSVRERVGENY